MASKFLAGRLLGDENATEEQIAEVIATQDPEILLKLKAANNDFKAKIKELGIQEKQLENKDREGARKLYTVNIWPQITLTILFVLGYFGILGALFFSDIVIPDSKQLILNVLLGVLTAGVSSILQFWFGSSSGSKDKTAKLK